MDIKKSQQDLDSTAENAEDTTLDRRDFFRKTAALSVTALAGTSLLASEEAGDPAILNPTSWGTKWGDPVTKNLYGMPSKYEHNVTRRYTKLLA
ncbi:MAG TPA: sulfite dehydrogenase, partial [Sulfurimonas autotrophica]|nr:sulfite dehydrogenase [Sulfurimonas autotrophica]